MPISEGDFEGHPHDEVVADVESYKLKRPNVFHSPTMETSKFVSPLSWNKRVNLVFADMYLYLSDKLTLNSRSSERERERMATLYHVM